MADIVRVNVDQPYEVVVGEGVIESVATRLRPGTTRVAILFAPAVAQQAHQLGNSLSQSVTYIELPDSESAKTFNTLEMCWNALGAATFTRSDAIISVGGGATTDVAGFVAASWLRGVDVIHVPTTLLAMVDAAVGGKTGINTAAGKNLVGAFHHPLAVFCDTTFLQTLPVEDLRAGFGEIIKCGFIQDATILADVDAHGDRLINPDHPLLPSLVARSIQVKADVVAGDFKESAPEGLGREILNYGHTLGHAIERVNGYSWRHGDAISVGMVFAAELAHRSGLMTAEFLAQHRNLISRLGLPITYDLGGWDELIDAMAIDKKARGNRLRFIVLSAQGRAQVLQHPDSDTLADAFHALASSN